MKILRVTLLVLLSGLTAKSQSLTIGEVKTLTSKVLKEDRTLNIYLPEGYRKDSTYPVLYLLDGSINEDFLHVVGLVQFFHMTFHAPDMVVVGIANVDRKRDFTFQPSDTAFTQAYPGSGCSETFIKFIEEELIPFVAHHYSVSDQRKLIGQSLGGLLATEIFIKKPSLFSHYGIVSPSLWWNDETLLEDYDSIMEMNPKRERKNVFIAYGANEHPIMKKDARALARKIKPEQAEVVLKEMKNEDHATILHNAVYQLFQYWFVKNYVQEENE